MTTRKDREQPTHPNPGLSRIVSRAVTAVGSLITARDADDATEGSVSELIAGEGGSIQIIPTGGSAEIRLRANVSTSDPSGTPVDGELWLKYTP